MLSKLLKYEIKATARIFLPLYAVVLVFAAINSLLFASLHEWMAPKVISMMIYIIILVGMFVITLVVMIQRFYKNLLSDEGYLMFTLPTKTWKLITSKLIISMMWIILSGLTGMISIFINAFDKVFTAESIQAVVDASHYLFSFFGGSTILIILEFVLAGVISLASNVLIIYASIAVGHLFNRYRILISLAAFLVLSAIPQILFSLSGAILGAINFPDHISLQNNLQTLEPFIHLTAWYSIIFSGLLAAGYFFVTNYILSKRLNLE